MDEAGSASVDGSDDDEDDDDDDRFTLQRCRRRVRNVIVSDTVQALRPTIVTVCV